MTITPTEKIILDFISGPEGTGDNYNAVIGNGKSKADLSRLSIVQIYQMQLNFVASGMPSGAIGRYQIIRKTLMSLVSRMQIPTTAKFTPELQDRFGVHLLKTRGLDRWLVEAISDARFGSNLSKEWASLPDPYNDGKSHYDGDAAGNHAGTTLAKVYDMLKKARDAGRVPSADFVERHKDTGPTKLSPDDALCRIHEAMYDFLLGRLSEKDALDRVQEAMRDAGCYSGKIDHEFGPLSRAGFHRLLALAGQPRMTS